VYRIALKIETLCFVFVCNFEKQQAQKDQGLSSEGQNTTHKETKGCLNGL
jgi:hypothetical protein